MSSDKKTKIINAVNNYSERALKELEPRTRSNKRPEKDVERLCLTWMRAQGWEVQIYESKATYSNGHWHNQAMQAGNADCQGIMPCGTSIAVEFKAPGALSTFLRDKNVRQRDFILRRINMNGFACVTDSVDRLEHIYKTWCDFKLRSQDLARWYLTDSLPRKK